MCWRCSNSFEAPYCIPQAVSGGFMDSIHPLTHIDKCAVRYFIKGICHISYQPSLHSQNLYHHNFMIETDCVGPINKLYVERCVLNHACIWDKSPWWGKIPNMCHFSKIVKPSVWPIWFRSQKWNRSHSSRNVAAVWICQKKSAYHSWMIILFMIMMNLPNWQFASPK
jgi:hypothetical protein